MRCPSCGAELEKDARFCHICGKPVPAAEAENRFCIRCGAKLPAGAAFCAHCGAAVSGGQTPQPAPVQQPTPAPQPVRTTESVTASPRSAPAPQPKAEPELRRMPPAATAPRPAETKKKKKKSKRSGTGGALVLIILIVALLFGIVCAFLYVEAYMRGISVKEYVGSSLGSEKTDGEPARWSDLKKTEPTPAPDAAADRPNGVGTKEVCALYMELLESRRAAIERYNWQQTDDGITRQIVVCDVWGDNLPELIWVEATNDENVAASTLNIAAIRDGAAAVLCSERWDVQAGGGFTYYLFQEQDSKALYAFSAYGEETWYECYADYAENGGGLAREELLKSVMTEEFDGENAWQSVRYTKAGAEIVSDAWFVEVERLLTGMKEILMYSAEPESYAVEFIWQHGCPAMSYDEAIKFLSDCLAAVP